MPPVETDIWIVNASPFIGLAKIGRLDLFTDRTRRVLLPHAVVEEIQAGEADDAATLAAGRLSDLGLAALPLIAPNPRLDVFRLDPGEAAVLTEALARPGSLAVIDDGPGRAAARALGVPLTGSLGVLIQARRDGRLPEIAPLVRGLRTAGIYLPRDADLRTLLATLGETWP